MFTNLKTSRANKDRVAELTRRLGLGTENIIARLALSYSLSKNRSLDLKNIQDSAGKEYSESILFGKYVKYYAGLVAVQYNLHISDRNLQKYIKLHIDDGLELIEKDLHANNNIEGFDFLKDMIAGGLTNMN